MKKLHVGVVIMAANKQCPYRSQEHECKQEPQNHTVSQALNMCNFCMKGQIADSIELVASALREKSITELEEEASRKVR